MLGNWSFLGSLTDPHDPKNYKPMAADWLVQGKHGRGWRNFGSVRAMSDQGAARKCFRDTGYRTIRVKPTDFPRDKWRRFTFRKRT